MTLQKLTPREFTKIAKLVYDRTGIHLPEEKLSLLSNRLRKRLRALDLEKFSQYYDLISDAKRCEEELPHFLSAVTTNETYFFRNEKLWKFFGEDLIKHFVQTKGKRPTGKSIRIWSAAASTGEEAYTAAMVLRERLPDFSSWTIHIVASDISRRVLDGAAEGVYNSYAVSKMPSAQIKRWFRSKDEAYHLRDEIRKMVRFQYHNLRDTFPNARFDIVFLRNVLMYFDTAMKKRVIEVVSEALAPGGHLIVGDVDPIRTTKELDAHMKLDYQRPGVYVKPTSKGAGVGEETRVKV